MVSSTLGDFVSLQRGTTYKSRLLNTPGPLLLGLASIERNGGFRADNLKTYGGESPEALLLRPGDLYVSLKDVTQSGDLLGAIARVPSSVSLGRLTQDTVKLCLSPDAPPASYLYWLLRTPEYRSYCRSHATGTTNLGLAREDFLAFGVPPVTRVRELFYESLDQLEAKIEQNRRTERALVRLARAIFRAWFVDFEPVKAKAEGASSFPSMPQSVFDALPVRFVDSAMGPVPEGWEVMAFGDLFVLQYGKALTADDRQPGSIPVYGSNGQIGWHNEAIAPGPGIIVGRKGNPGTVTCSQGPFFPIDTTFFVRLTDARASLPLLFHQLRAADLGRLASDSAVPGVNRNMIYGERCVLPDESILGAFDRLVLGLWELQTWCDKESGKLVEARDYLLPKLLSDDVRVEVADG